MQGLAAFEVPQMKTAMGDTITIAPQQQHSHTIILLHGRDSTAPEFAEELFESQASDDRTLPEIFPTVKWVFPSSRLRMSTRFEMEMSQWFDMWSVEEPQEREGLQITGLRESAIEVLNIIRNEAVIVRPERIILGGISQGCATAIFALLVSCRPLGGFIGLSSWMPFQTDLERIMKISNGNDSLLQRFREQIGIPIPTNGDTSPSVMMSQETPLQSTPIFLAHCKDDDVVPIRNGETLRRSLDSLGFRVDWKTYNDGGHWLNEPQGVDDMVLFLKQITK